MAEKKYRFNIGPGPVVVGGYAYGPGQNIDITDKAVGEALIARGYANVASKDSAAEPQAFDPQSTGAEPKPTGDQGPGAPTTPAGGAETALPEDFPSRDLLAAAGITTYEAVEKLDGDFDSVDGVGPAKGEEILAEVKDWRENK